MKDKKNIKETLHNFEFEVDNNALWSALEEHVPTPKKKRRGLFFIFFFGLIGLLSVSTLYFNNDTPEEIASISHSNNSQDLISTTHTQRKANNNNNNIVLTKKATKSSSSSSSDKPNTPIYATSKSTTKKRSQSKASNTTPFIQQNEIDQTQNPIVITENSAQKEDLNKANIEGAKPTEVITTNDIEKKRSKQSLKPIDLLTIYPLLTPNDYIIAMSLIDPIKHNRESNYFIQFGFGMGQSNTSFNSPSDESAYVKDLKSKFSDLPSLHFNTIIGKQINPRWQVYTGFDYLRTTDRLIIDIKEEEQTQEAGTTTTIDPSGNASESSSTTTTTILTEYFAKYHTYHNYLSIPLGFKYQVWNNGLFDVRVGGAMAFNILELNKGAILNTQGTLDAFDFDDGPYRRSWFQPKATLSIDYHLDYNNQIGIELNSTLNNGGYSIGNSEIKQLTSTNQIDLYYQYKF